MWPFRYLLLIEVNVTPPRNILRVIRSRDENNMLVMAVCGDVLRGKYSRNQFEVCKVILLNKNDVKFNADVFLRGVSI